MIEVRPTLHEFIHDTNATECYFPHWPYLHQKIKTNIKDYVIRLTKRESGICLETLNGGDVVAFPKLYFSGEPHAYSHYYVYDNVKDAISAVIASFDESIELLSIRVDKFEKKKEQLLKDIENEFG